MLSGMSIWATWNVGTDISKDFSLDFFAKYTCIGRSDVEKNILFRAPVRNAVGTDDVLVKAPFYGAIAAAIKNDDTAYMRVPVTPCTTWKNTARKARDAAVETPPETVESKAKRAASGEGSAVQVPPAVDLAEEDEGKLLAGPIVDKSNGDQAVEQEKSGEAQPLSDVPPVTGKGASAGEQGSVSEESKIQAADEGFRDVPGDTDKAESEPAVTKVPPLGEDLSPKEVKEEALQDEIFEKHIMLVPSEPRVPTGAGDNAEKKPRDHGQEGQAQEVLPPATRSVQKPLADGALKKGALYVQIGRFKNVLNAEGFVQRFGKRYPAIVEKLSVPKTSTIVYRVYIGPLKKDEWGAVLETFKSIGFEDAFLKKIP